MKTEGLLLVSLFMLNARDALSLIAQLTTFRLCNPSLMVLDMAAPSFIDVDRRAFLSTSGRAGALAALLPFTGLQPSFAAATKAAVNYKAVANDIEALIKEDKSKGPSFVRLAWHSSGTYDRFQKNGGSEKGTIRFPEELAHGANGGLKEVIGWLAPIYDKYAPDGLSFADLVTLSGVVAIRTLGGPTINWKSGRVDGFVGDVTPDGRLPDADVPPPGADPADAAHLREIFYRMGFDDREIVALSGAHSMGRAHIASSGYDGPWTFTPNLFSNFYFIFLRDKEDIFKWQHREGFVPFQYESAKKNLMMLPTDIVLMEDEKFKKYVNIYADSNATFRKDFANAFQKLLELGTTNLVPTKWT